VVIVRNRPVYHWNLVGPIAPVYIIGGSPDLTMNRFAAYKEECLSHKMQYNMRCWCVSVFMTGSSMWCISSINGKMLFGDISTFFFSWQSTRLVAHNNSFNKLLVAQYSLWSEDFQIFCVPLGRIHSRTCGCKGSLLKVREGKCKREHCGCRWNLEAKRACCFSPGAFQT
jgi:hypothetical protein